MKIITRLTRKKIILFGFLTQQVIIKLYELQQFKIQQLTIKQPINPQQYTKHYPPKAPSKTLQMYSTQQKYCTNCKQYHIRYKQNIKKNNDKTQFKYSDLVNYLSISNQKKFNIQVKVIKDNFRQIYDQEIRSNNRKNKYYQNIKTSNKKNIVNKTQSYKKIVKKQIPINQNSSYELKIQNEMRQQNKKKQVNKTYNNFQQLKKQIKISQQHIKFKIDLCHHFTQQIQFSQSSSSTIALLHPQLYHITYVRQSDKKQIYSSLATTIDIKKSRPYGENGKHILNSRQQLKSTNQTQRKQDISNDSEVVNIYRAPSTKQAKVPIFEHDKLDQLKGESGRQKKQDKGKQKIEQLDYNKKIKQLKQILNSNIFNKQYVKGIINNTKDNNNDSYGCQKLKQQQYINDMHQPNINGDEIFYSQHKDCTYFDNRCFGLSLFNQELIYFGNDQLL